MTFLLVHTRIFLLVKLPNGHMRLVELHWFEAHGIGKKDLKIKHYLD